MTNLLLFIVLFLAACSSPSMGNGSTTMADSTVPEKILIVYLSRTKNTKAVAEMIHQKVGGRLVALELQQSYPEDYKETVAQVSRENETGFLPKLKTIIDSMKQYKVVFVGFPTWGMKLPPPVKSFLKQHDLSGKTVVPFNTNAGHGVGSCFETVKELCAGSKVLEGFSTKGGIERDGVMLVMEGGKRRQVADDVTKWLQRIHVIDELHSDSK